MWSIPRLDEVFSTRMMDVLEVYERPYDPTLPVVCLDEKSKQLLSEVRTPLPVCQGKPHRYDYEYRRNGTVNLFVVIEPKGKRRTVRVTRRRTKKDYASFVKFLVTHGYQKAKKIILVEDNLNTHNRETLIEVLGVKEGKRIARKIEWHYTPTHASWLNQAEIEISALSTQCLKQRIPAFQDMQKQTAAWVRDRNSKRVGINWQFTREEATRKFKL